MRDDRGVVQIRDIPAGSYQVCVGAYNFSSLCHSVEIKDGVTATLEDVLSASGSLTWMITTQAGKPLGQVRCSLVHADNPEANRDGITNQQGLWYATDLAPGHYEGTAQVAGIAAIRNSFDISAGQQLRKLSMAGAE